MEQLLHQIVAGLATGCAYALLALSLVVVYRCSKHVNFAQGEMATLSAYGAFAMLQAGLPYWAAFVGALVLSFLGGAAVERLIIGRLKAVSPLATVATFIGLFMAIHSLTGYFWGHDVRDFPSPFPDISLMGGLVSGQQLGVMLTTAFLLATLWAFFRFTRIGLAVRAAAMNPDSAQLSGISTRLMFSMGWGLAAMLGAVAALLLAPVLYLDPSMMSGVLIYGFAAAVLGGLNSVPGAVVGGLLLGVLENLLGTYVVGSQLKLTVALIALVSILIWRPHGLFGKPSAERV
ncbi:branched-chain amino acid ABC transporter permease [Variovorax sp. OV700]|uniref:branched-chain amino acid ABC transporter permease n=1 Tax=Variovorax sp. OV700 TaxID=1882826 RepID=UPI000881E21A|nr:branched-chain amino acid ABC transporter permease [Variovorax sp. OV700]SDH85790.1 amino acid/amide ABC transporter membrane protein 1, HAAT family [Variovorax sp. OV700]